MNRYTGKLKVVCQNLMCFPADPKTLEATGCECYDPYAIIHPEEGPVETISLAEWHRRRLEVDKVRRGTR